MAGGKGTRLRPLTFIRPKPMLPLVNKPIVEHVMEQLKQFHMKDSHINTKLPVKRY